MGNSLRACPQCGRTVLSSGLSCPYCNEFLEAPGRRTRDSNPPGSGNARLERTLVTLALTGSVTIFALLFVVFFLWLLSGKTTINKPEKLRIAPDALAAASARPKNTRSIASARSVNTLGGNSASSPPVANPNPPEKPSEQDRKREERIQDVFHQVLSDLQKEEAVTSDTVYLKAGGKIECEIIAETDNRLKIHRRNATMTIGKDKVENIDHRTPEDVTQQLRQLAMAEATKIVDGGLVKDGRKWVSPEEAARHKSELNSDALGGKLQLTPANEPNQRGNSPADALSRVFDASGKKLDLAKLCSLFPSPIKASGMCEVEGTIKFDEGDLTAWNGWTSVNGENLTVSSVDAGIVILPANNDAALGAKFTAQNGKVSVESFRLNGRAYDLAGTGLILLSNAPEQRTIDLSLSVVLKQPPTVTDQQLLSLGAKQFMDGLVAARTRVPLKFVGPFNNPQLQLAPGTALDSLVRQVKR